MRGAHRVAWIQAKGEIPEGMCVCHKCDNPPCINVEHLFLGTNADNVRDREEKGRGNCGCSRGELNPYSKLEDKDISKIHELLYARVSQREIAQIYGVSQKAISNIKQGKAWSHIQSPYPSQTSRAGINRGKLQPNAKLKDVDIPTIHELIYLGYKLTDIAKMYAVSKQTIFKIKQGKIWRHIPSHSEYLEQLLPATYRE